MQRLSNMNYNMDHLFNRDEDRLLALPSSCVTYETLVGAVRHNGRNLKHIRSDLITVELCVLAIQQNEFFWEYVPQELRDEVRERVENTGDIMIKAAIKKLKK